MRQTQSSLQYFSKVLESEGMEGGKTMKPWTKIRCYLQLYCMKEALMADRGVRPYPLTAPCR